MFCKKHKFVFILASLIFAATVSHSFAKFTVKSPTDKDTLLTGNELVFSWNGDSQYNVSIYLSSDSGATWELIDSNIHSTSYKWKIPFHFNLNLKFRLTNNYTVPPHLVSEIIGAQQSEIRTVQFSDNDKYILTSSAYPEIKIWQSDNLKLFKTFDLNSYIKSSYESGFYGAGDTVMVAGDSSVLLISLSDNKIRKYSDDSIKYIVRALVSNPVYPVFAAASNTGPGIDDGVVAVYEINSGMRIADFRADELSQIRDVSFSEDGKLLAFSDYNGKIYIYDWLPGNLIKVLRGHGESGGSRLVYSCNFDKNAGFLVSGGGDETVRVWDINDGSNLAVMSGHESQVWKTIFHPKQKWVLSASLDSMLIQWDYKSGKVLHNPINHGGEVLSADYNSDGSLFASGGRDNSLRLWKNFESYCDSVLITPVIKYPVKVRIPDLTGNAGIFILMQLILEIPDSVPIQKFNNQKCTYVLEIPSRTIETFGNLSGFKTYPKDTIYGFAIINATKDTLLKSIVQLLITDVIPDTIKILDFKVESDDFYINKADGLVTVLKECIGDNGRSFYAGSNVGAILVPNPATDFVNLTLNMPETGNVIINICDIKGKILKSFKTNIDKSLKNEIIINLSELVNGEYILLIESQNIFLSRQFKIFR